jgi:hypothetical protein
VCVIDVDDGGQVLDECRLQVLYQTRKDQQDLSNAVGIVMHRDWMRAGGIRRPMSQMALEHGCTAC